MACNWRSAKPWMGSLCNSPTRTTHHALQKDSELSAAAGKPSSVKTCLPDEEPLLWFSLFLSCITYIVCLFDLLEMKSEYEI